MSTPERWVEAAQAHVLAGDFAAAAPLFERAGRALLPTARLREGAAVLVAAARLHLLTGDRAAAGKLIDQAEAGTRALRGPADRGLRRDLLVARAELAVAREQAAGGPPGLLGDAAWSACLAASEGAERLGPLRVLAERARLGNRVADMLPWLTEAIDLARALGDQERAADALLERAIAHHALDHVPASNADLDAAWALLTDAPSALRARILGQRGALAVTAGALDDAAEYAEAARAEAVAVADPQTYLGACALLSLVQHQRHDLVGAYDTLVRARASLQDLLGPDGAALARPALEAFEARLGPEAFEAVHQAWVSRRLAAAR